MTVRYLTGDVTNIDLSEFMSIESTGPYDAKCSTCRKDEDLGIIQVLLSSVVMMIASLGVIHYLTMALVSPTSVSIVGTIASLALLMTAFWFFMPREGGDHRYIRAWSKLPVIGPKLESNVAIAKIAYKEEIAARYSMYHKMSAQGVE